MEISFAKPYDFHVHLRDGQMLQLVAPITAAQFYRALVMPNLRDNPVLTLSDAQAYRARILDAVGPSANFEPLMTIKIRPDTTKAIIRECKHGQLTTCVVAGKVYPKGLTTHSDDGVENFLGLYSIFQAMEESGLVLCLHGEMPGDDITSRDREREFLRTLKFIAKTFPGLRIVMEHITTAAAVDTILDLPGNVAATITLHHLMLTCDDVGGDHMHPDHYCKPIPKDRADLLALRMAATSGCPKFFFGSDSAPHPRTGKERGKDCCAGIFTAPVALPLLAEVFEWDNALDRLEGFVRHHGWQFYGTGEPAADRPRQITLTKEPWEVPPVFGSEPHSVVPFAAGRKITWRLKE